MPRFHYKFASVAYLLLLTFTFTAANGQQKQEKTQTPSGPPIIWQKVNISELDLFLGPGGKGMLPDLSKIAFVSEGKSETAQKRGKVSANKKYKIKDGAGRAWTAKLNTRNEARSEAAAVRLLFGIGYGTEVNYLVPTLTIPGKGTFENVRLKGHRDGEKTLDDPWKWRDNPFIGTNELQGLKIMMAFMTNWDLTDVANDVLYNKNSGETHYVVGDVDATFGRYGNNGLPLFYRLGRKSSSPQDWSKAKFISGVKDGKIQFAVTGGKGRDLFNDITIEQGRWLCSLLVQLREAQIKDAFRAANFSPSEIELLTLGVKRRITELQRATSSEPSEKPAVPATR